MRDDVGKLLRPQTLNVMRCGDGWVFLGFGFHFEGDGEIARIIIGAAYVRILVTPDGSSQSAGDARA
jgi:hypothetical protein